jgi:hypothetical protein
MAATEQDRDIHQFGPFSENLDGLLASSNEGAKGHVN